MHLLATIAFFVILSMLLFSCVFWLGVWASMVVLIRGESRRRQRAAARSAGAWPSVSILKPLKGCDPQAVENFSSFCRQNYPGEVELLFAVADANDPACDVVRQMQCGFPERSVALMVAPPLGANPKTALLHHLAGKARGEVLVISDSDVRVGPEYLQAVVQPLRDEARVGVVTCPYRVEHARGLTARLESLGRAGFLVPAAVFAATALGEPLGLGATIAIRRADLQRSGGFAAMADHLADDNRLARQIHSLGLAIYMSGEVVSIVSDGWCNSLRGLWDREIRWARAERVACGTLKYLGMTLTFTITLSLLALACEWGRLGMIPGWLIGLTAAATAMRFGVAGRSAALLGYPMDLFDLLLVLPRALMAPVIWLSALSGRHVVWRGQEFLLQRDGRLTPRRSSAAAPAPAASPATLPAGSPAAARGSGGGLLNRITHAVDAHLRQEQGIWEFSHDPRCVFRISAEKAPYPLLLDDGIPVAGGDPIGELHFWSEHLPPIAPTGATLAWARQAMTAAEFSLRELARSLRSDPALQKITALHGSASFVARHGDDQLQRMLHRLGFEVHADPRRRTWAQHLHDFGENILIWMLVRAYNPGSLGSRPPLLRPRQQVWMSREALLRRYGEPAVPTPLRRVSARPSLVEA